MKEHDRDNSNTLEYSEFILASIDRKKFLSQSRLKNAFGLFDVNGDGSIEIEEIKKVFS